MGKRPKVPVALQSEISGYLGLLRALRATSTLDLTSHLIQSSQSPSNEQDDHPLLDSVLYPRDSSEFLSDYASQATLAEATPKSPEPTLKTATGHGTLSSRDTWTRWPVLAADVPIPEWDLEDEVRVLAARTLKQSRPRDLEATVDSIGDQDLGDINGDEEREDTLLTPIVVNALTEATSKYLAKIFASMAEIHRPAPSLSNRIRPYDWESVLTVANHNGLIDNMKLEDMRQRMSTIIQGDPGASQSSLFQPLIVSRALRQTQALDEDSLFTLEGYIPPSPPTPPKRPYRKRTASKTVDESETVTVRKRKMLSGG